jgi:hypothetical protein
MVERDFFIVDGIVDKGYGACGSCVLVIMVLIVFDFGQFDFGIGVMTDHIFFLCRH